MVYFPSLFNIFYKVQNTDIVRLHDYAFFNVKSKNEKF